MAPNSDASKGDFKDTQFDETEVARKVVEQCELESTVIGLCNCCLRASRSRSSIVGSVGGWIPELAMIVNLA
jgi:hypothetical protein